MKKSEVDGVIQKRIEAFITIQDGGNTVRKHLSKDQAILTGKGAGVAASDPRRGRLDADLNTETRRNPKITM